jgi:hypothetical protein
MVDGETRGLGIGHKLRKLEKSQEELKEGRGQKAEVRA